MTDTDKGQIGLSEGSRALAEEVVEKGGFDDLQDLYRLAIAVALIKDLEPTAEDVGGRKTTFGSGSLDQDGSIRTAIVQIREDGRERPYAFAERLAEAGIADLHEHLDGGRSIREYLAGLTKTEKGD